MVYIWGDITRKIVGVDKNLKVGMPVAIDVGDSSKFNIKIFISMIRITAMFFRINTISLLLLMVITLAGCATSRYQNVDLYMRQQNWQRAEEELELHLLEHPTDTKAQLMLAEVYGEQGKAEKMLSTLSRVPNENDRHTANIDFIKKKYWIYNLQAGQEG